MSPAHTLIVSPAWIGDAVMTQALLKRLKADHPERAIDVLAPGVCVDVFERMPEVSSVIPSPFGHGEFKLSKRYALGRFLAKQGYQQVIVTPNSWKSALVPFFAGIPKRIGWRGEWRYGLLNDVRVLDPQRYPLMVQRLLALGLAPDAPLPDHKPWWPQLTVSDQRVATTREALQLYPSEQPILALCPGAAFGEAKRWPAAYFAQVANQRLDQGWGVWIFGSKSDSAIAAEIQAQTQERCVDLTAKTSVGQAIDCLTQTTKVLTNDTGLMHIAAALGVSVVALYGSSSPEFTPPLSERVTILQHPIECSPCFERVCPLSHFKCMTELTPEQVLASL